MSQRSYTKNEYILDPRSDWNAAEDNEPVFVVRASNWRAVIFLAALVTNKDATGWALNVAERMKAWDDATVSDDDIPF